MKRTKAQRLLAAACGPALGVLVAVPVGGLLAGAAGAEQLLHGLHDAHHRHHDTGSHAGRWAVDNGVHHIRHAGHIERTGFHRR